MPRQRRYNEPTKKVSYYPPISEYLRIRHEAARQRIPIAELIRRWVEPNVKKI